MRTHLVAAHEEKSFAVGDEDICSRGGPPLAIILISGPAALIACGQYTASRQSI